MDEDQKYADFKPGKISINLKEALGLRNNELPPYIYRMRVLGYPPGWVEEAFESQSELSLFDSNGKMVGTSKKNECKVDPDKIIEYVGFNAPMDKYMKDVCIYYLFFIIGRKTAYIYILPMIVFNNILIKILVE